MVRDHSVTVTAGGRVDLGLTMPADGSPLRVQVSKGTAVILGTGDLPAPPAAGGTLDLLAYGTPRPEGLGFDPNRPDRTFEYSIGRRPGFVRGWPGLWWSINGHLFPNVPMFVVREGDVVRMHIDDHSGEVHPMHLHGHHAVVLARNGVPATGSPWWVDSLNVRDGETYDIAFVADNPGDLDGPLPQPRARRGRDGGAPDVRGRDHPVHDRARDAATPGVISRCRAGLGLGACYGSGRKSPSWS